MQERGFDAIAITGPAMENPAMLYMTNRACISGGMVIKKRGEAPVLICYPMEREEGAKSGLETVTFSEFDLYKLTTELGSAYEAILRVYASIFERFGIKGTVSFYGLGDPGRSFVMLSQLNERLPDITITGEVETSIFDLAYATKDADELAAIQSVAKRTNIVMAEVVDFLKGHAAADDRLVKADGAPLTVGDVKRFIQERLMAVGLEEADPSIFAIGRDAGIPHSRGEASDFLELGKSIIFDLFPRERGGGYFHDMTRTFCLGHAPPEVNRLYDEVMAAFQAAEAALQVGQPCKKYQEMVCDYFEVRGYPTIRSNPSTTEGYVHSLGHGLGLEIHSSPSLSAISKDVFEPGQVFTIEPGLYYPEKGYGVRIEDTFYIDEDGHFHSLSTFSKELVLVVGKK
jgi:Xaa-Pro aminopeptidase